MPISAPPIRLGVNIDHVATIRQVRLSSYPSPLEAAIAAEQAGASGITLHLREDRRHIQEQDLVDLRQHDPNRYVNLEMAVDATMLHMALKHRPAAVCLVPEKRQELTTEGGLDVVRHLQRIKPMVQTLQQQGIQVSLFVDAQIEQLYAAAETTAECIELHTGEYANLPVASSASSAQLRHLFMVAEKAHDLGLIVNAGHGLNYENTQAVVAMPYLHELNIGHAIVARALIVGMRQAVAEMLRLIRRD